MVLAVLLAAAFAAVPARAHVMSISSGELVIDGNNGRYEIRMPAYEIGHIREPEVSLFDNIHFAAPAGAARLMEKSCRHDPAQQALICEGTYEFPGPVDRLEVQCAFHRVTVANHVHLLRARSGERTGEASFELSSTRAEIRFDPPSALETALSRMGAGLTRAVGGLPQILFLATLALAARGRRELAALAGMFLAGQAAAAVIGSRVAWEPAPRFVEAATALTVAYMAVEILALPKAGQRWIVAGALGAFHGLYFAMYLRTSGYGAAGILAGAAFGELALIAAFAAAFARIPRPATRVSAALLLCTGLAWFFLRLQG